MLGEFPHLLGEPGGGLLVAARGALLPALLGGGRQRAPLVPHYPRYLAYNTHYIYTRTLERDINFLDDSFSGCPCVRKIWKIMLVLDVFFLLLWFNSFSDIIFYS